MIQKKAVCETPKPLQLQHTHTHTHNYKHIKYQRMVKQTKVNTLKERGPRTLYKQVWPDKSHLYWKQEWVQVSLSTHLKGLVPHTFSDESNKLETYIYITRLSIYISNKLETYIYITRIYIYKQQGGNIHIYNTYIYIYIYTYIYIYIYILK